ncbi:MAG: sel1 repeat family protein [Paludibacteraceae bacterium]|nr:sel1 repeat family protein [Paludibacteraceae bacterium]
MQIYLTVKEKDFRPYSKDLHMGDYCLKKSGDHCIIYLISKKPLPETVIEEYPYIELFNIEIDVLDAMIFSFDNLGARQGNKELIDLLSKQCLHTNLRFFFSHACNILRYEEDCWDINLLFAVNQNFLGNEDAIYRPVENEQIQIHEKKDIPSEFEKAKLKIQSINFEEQKLGFEIIHNVALNENNSEAFYIIAKCYQNGIGTKSSIRSAISWFKKAAENKDKDSARELGKIYYNNPLYKSYYDSFSFFKKAAILGDAESLYMIGLYYDNGFYHKTDYKLAALHYELAAAEDYSNAFYRIALMYKKGNYYEKSESDYLHNLEKAIQLGCEEAKLELEKYKSSIPALDRVPEQAVSVSKLYFWPYIQNLFKISKKEGTVVEILSKCYAENPYLFHKAINDFTNLCPNTNIFEGRKSVESKRDVQIHVLKEYLDKKNLNYVDNLESTNVIWVVGPRSLELDKVDIILQYKLKPVFMPNGAKSTGKQPAWQIAVNRS